MKKKELQNSGNEQNSSKRGKFEPRQAPAVICSYHLLPESASHVVQYWLANTGDTGDGVRSLGGEDPWRRKRQPSPVFLPGKSYGQRTQMGYSPWDREETDTTKPLSLQGVAGEA